ncbi:hypothetical protein PR048_000094 [Dryococelus australis]|uniref:Uncharacterized protein n=1 Tax=Dryococelus australis TaxID=614101 RepID=A0ABQ9IE97_9NEOP|nr:hypothetical protein PR048_000094 [Dryococelus australis]
MVDNPSEQEDLEASCCSSTICADLDKDSTASHPAKQSFSSTYGALWITSILITYCRNCAITTNLLDEK